MAITQFIYPATLTKDEDGRYLVKFPDLPEAHTDGVTKEEALKEAMDCLTQALFFRMKRKKEIPTPSQVKKGMAGVVPEPDISLKAALYMAMSKEGITAAELARRLITNHKEARRIIDPAHKTKLPRIAQALALVGREVVVGIGDSVY